MRLTPLLALIVSLSLLCDVRSAQGAGRGSVPGFTQPDARTMPDLFVWQDTCNVWVLRDGDSALLIDLGDGSVLKALPNLGIKRVEWVLFTHHHREQCQGAPLLAGTVAKVGVPAAERALFERPTDFRKMKVRLGDVFTVHGASYVRPPIQPIPVDREFSRMDTFTWCGHEFWCVDTRGNSPGAMSYLLRHSGRWLAFTGDLMMEGATLHTWHDSEWDYGFGAGVWALANSAAQIAGYDPAWMLPSHGPAIREPSSQLAAFQRKLFRFERLLVRGYPVNSFASASQDPLSRPTAVPHVWQVSPHLYKFRGPDFFPNFYLLVADSGRALAIDCGLLDTNKLDAALSGMKQHLGLKQIDAVIPTHMHGDHFLQAPHLKVKHGAQIWGLDRMAEVCAHPERFDYAAPIQAYGTGVDGVRFDRQFRDGETLHWEGYTLTVDWMPGQTEFALAVRGTIDKRKVVFTGDNIFGNPADENQTGHEAMVARNSAILEEGYIVGAEYLSNYQPDLLLGGHSYVMPKPSRFIGRYRRWAYEMRDAFQDLIHGKDYRYGFDPFWVRAEPYRLSLATGNSGEIALHVRNFLKRSQRHEIQIHVPPGLIAEPAVLRGELNGEARGRFPVRLTAKPGAAAGHRIVAFDVTLDGHRLGERFDCIVQIEPAAPRPIAQIP